MKIIYELHAKLANLAKKIETAKDVTSEDKVMLVHNDHLPVFTARALWDFFNVLSDLLKQNKHRTFKVGLAKSYELYDLISFIRKVHILRKDKLYLQPKNISAEEFNSINNLIDEFAEHYTDVILREHYYRLFLGRIHEAASRISGLLHIVLKLASKITVTEPTGLLTKVGVLVGLVEAPKPKPLLKPEVGALTEMIIQRLRAAREKLSPIIKGGLQAVSKDNTNIPHAYNEFYAYYRIEFQTLHTLITQLPFYTTEVQINRELDREIDSYNFFDDAENQRCNGSEAFSYETFYRLDTECYFYEREFSQIEKVFVLLEQNNMTAFKDKLGIHQEGQKLSLERLFNSIDYETPQQYGYPIAAHSRASGAYMLNWLSNQDYLTEYEYQYKVPSIINPELVAADLQPQFKSLRSKSICSKGTRLSPPSLLILPIALMRITMNGLRNGMKNLGNLTAKLAPFSNHKQTTTADEQTKEFDQAQMPSYAMALQQIKDNSNSSEYSIITSTPELPCVFNNRQDFLDEHTNIIKDSGNIPKDNLLAPCKYSPPPRVDKTTCRGVINGSKAAIPSVFRETLIALGYTPREAAGAELAMTAAITAMNPDSLLPFTLSLFVKTCVRKLGVSETRAQFTGALAGFGFALWKDGGKSLYEVGHTTLGYWLGYGTTQLIDRLTPRLRVTLFGKYQDEQTQSIKAAHDSKTYQPQT